jgi:hypothetical protein
MRIVTISSTLITFAAVSFGQVGPNPVPSVLATNYDVKTVRVAAMSTSTQVTFNLSPTMIGGDVLDVVTSDPTVAVSLVLPSGTSLTAANASTLSYSFSSIPTGTMDTSIAPSPFGMPGTHTVITFPSGQAAGTYVVGLNAAAAANDSAAIIYYLSAGPEEMAAATDSGVYRAGDTVILSAFVSDGSQPVTNATVTAYVTVPVMIPANVTNYQLISQQAVDASNTSYSYTATFNNAGAPAYPLVEAKVQCTDPTVIIQKGVVEFGDLAAGSSVTSPDAFVIVLPNGATLDSSTLVWTATTTADPVPVSLQDSGTFDYAGGDGIYTGTFPGNYTALMKITGAIVGQAFSRTTAVQFHVTDQLATFQSIQGAAVDTDGNGLPDTLRITASVTVQRAGHYQFSAKLVASNGTAISGSTTLDLSTGSSQVLLDFPASRILTLGVDGPYSVSNVRLFWMSDTIQDTADYQSNAGLTPALTLATLDLGSLYFTGQNSASGVDLTGSGAFDILRVQAAVFAPAGACTWTGVLYSQQGSTIDTSYGSGTLSAGSNSVTFNFNGSKIALAGDGPYTVSATVICGSASASMNPRFQTQSFTASQFHSVPPGFALSLPDNSRMMSVGSTISVLVAVAAAGAFNGNVTFSVAGLPAGVTASVFPSTVFGSGMTTVTLTANSGTAPGAYQLSITGTSVLSQRSVCKISRSCPKSDLRPRSTRTV